MKTNTKYFGEVEYQEEDVLTFPQGLFAFEDEHRFLLLPLAGSSGSLLSLQSLATPELAFVLMDPFALNPGYLPTPQPEEVRQMGVEDFHDLCYYVMCVVKEPVADSTVNLRCPVLINTDTGRGMQVILDSGEYHMTHPLSEFGKGEEEAPC